MLLRTSAFIFQL